MAVFSKPETKGEKPVDLHSAAMLWFDTLKDVYAPVPLWNMYEDFKREKEERDLQKSEPSKKAKKQSTQEDHIVKGFVPHNVTPEMLAEKGLKVGVLVAYKSARMDDILAGASFKIASITTTEVKLTMPNSPESEPVSFELNAVLAEFKVCEPPKDLVF